MLGPANLLKERFLAAPEFRDLHTREYAAVYGGGQALAELDRLAGVVAARGLVEATTVDREAAAVRSKLETQAALGLVPAATPERGISAKA